MPEPPKPPPEDSLLIKKKTTLVVIEKAKDPHEQIMSVTIPIKKRFFEKLNHKYEAV